MPNWCGSDVHIQFTNEADMNKFDRMLGDKSLTDTFMPMPGILSGTRSPSPTEAFDADGKRRGWVDDPDSDWNEEMYVRFKHEHETYQDRGAIAKAQTGYSNWHEWAIAKWGTKWGDTDLHCVADSSGTGFSLSYSTPWGPLSASFWECVSKAFPTASIILTWEEPGMCQAGAQSYTDGFCAYDESQTVSDLACEAECALDLGVDAARLISYTETTPTNQQKEETK